MQTQRRAQLNWTVLPENAYNKEVTFASADESIAVVDANGLVTGVSVGQTVITAATVGRRNHRPSVRSPLNRGLRL